MLKTKAFSIKRLSVLFACALSIFYFPAVFADEKVVNLVVSYKTVNFAGKPVRAIAVNNQIPGPTLHFKQGDHVTINVYNHLDKGTSIHWHGILVPWQMDGVSGVSQKPIPPGGVFHYQFTLYQSGTYWYHAHAGLQEQQGLYGAFVVDPIKPPPYRYTKDYVIVLSDWSNTKPEQILANLKKEGDFYSVKFPLQPSLSKFITDYRKATNEQKRKLLSDYKMMQQMRMSIYDISDVAYDAFLLNGQTKNQPWIAPVKVGDIVRLRFIGASASTNFNVKIHNAPLKMVHVEGNNVKPHIVQNFYITPGETYDALVRIERATPHIIYAESADTLGAAIGALVTDPQQILDFKEIPPFPEPQPVTMGHDMSHGMHHMHMSNMNDQSSLTSGSKYKNLTAAVKTNDPNKPIYETIKMDLSGYMDRYIWFINGIPEYKAKPIIIQPNKRYRIIFTNSSMMHHPMHIHGHWFILRNGHGAYDPLLHTVDVAPGSSIVVDFDTDASGQWIFHCHHLYHMMSGMARVFQYSTLVEIVEGKKQPEQIVSHLPYANQAIVKVDKQIPINPFLITHTHGHHPGELYMANFLDIGEAPFTNTQEVTFKSLFGGDYNKLELFMNDAEMDKGTVENADLDIFYWRLISQFWAIKAGANYFYRPSGTPYLQPGIGIEGLMPYFIDTDLRVYYHNGSTKFDLELSRETQITNRFFIRAGVRGIFATKTLEEDEIGSGLNQMRYTISPYYRLTPNLALFVEYENVQDYGTYKNIITDHGESTTENTLFLGLSLLF